MFLCRWLELHTQNLTTVLFCLRSDFNRKATKLVRKLGNRAEDTGERSIITRTKWVWKMQCEHKQWEQGWALAGTDPGDSEKTREGGTWDLLPAEPATPRRGPRKSEQQGGCPPRSSPGQRVCSFIPWSHSKVGAHGSWVISDSFPHLTTAEFLTWSFLNNCIRCQRRTCNSAHGHSGLKGCRTQPGAKPRAAPITDAGKLSREVQERNEHTTPDVKHVWFEAPRLVPFSCWLWGSNGIFCTGTPQNCPTFTGADATPLNTTEKWVADILLHSSDNLPPWRGSLPRLA